MFERAKLKNCWSDFNKLGISVDFLDLECVFITYLNLLFTGNKHKIFAPFATININTMKLILLYLLYIRIIRSKVNIYFMSYLSFTRAI